MDKMRLLFVCLGNICRSPSAEAVMTALVEKHGAGGRFEIDSAGIIGVHEGEPADSRMKRLPVSGATSSTASVAPLMILI